MEQRFAGKDHNIGRFRLAVTSAKPPIPLTVGLPEGVLKALAAEPEERTDAQRAELANYYRSIDPELGRLNLELTEYGPPGEPRLIGAQDLAWALLNSPAFLFNH
jgi:hypothetical protein